MRLSPQDCQTKIQCDACSKPYSRNEWTTDELKKFKHRSTKLVCKSCRAKGCTAYNPTFYTCKTCGKEKGCKRFDSKQLDNHRDYNRTKLECLECRQKTTDRERVLRGRFKQSKWFCKCGNPIHDLLCPLSTVVHDKRRWPGGDLDENKRQYITEDDKLFLSALNPRPKWWANALRKPK